MIHVKAELLVYSFGITVFIRLKTSVNYLFFENRFLFWHINIVPNKYDILLCKTGNVAPTDQD